MIYPACHSEKDRIITSIIQSLDAIDGGMRELESLLAASGRPLPFVLLDAETAIERLIVTYQVAESVVQKGYARGYLTGNQIQSLNRELQRSAQRLIALSTCSAILAQKVQEKLGMVNVC
ncbi:MAG: hypothetical protein QMD46_01735 [Methanomicrobiales archaeon]|nr:hypothetical protein [Methanomicrobiales archaeon]MDI6875162.1 hypothetical protein [Methanomicrobiales archaeon]